VQLRAVEGRALFVGQDGDTEREAEPGNLPLGAELTDALHEWARVVNAVRGTEDGDNIGALVSRRGKQLAGRVSAVMGVPVGYVDPLSGEVSEVTTPVHSVAHGRHRQARPEPAVGPVEPTPWATGLAVSAFVATVVLFSVVTLTNALADNSGLLALGANVLVAAGLAPSVWLARDTPGWRWAAFGVIGGLLAAWFVLLISLL
jgi:hypothetical protein